MHPFRTLAFGLLLGLAAVPAMAAGEIARVVPFAPQAECGQEQAGQPELAIALAHRSPHPVRPSSEGKALQALAARPFWR